MKKSNIFITALLLALLLPAGASAEERAGAFSVSPMVGGYVFDNEQDIEKDMIGGMGFGYNFTEHWATELMFSYGRFDHEYFDLANCCCAEDEVDGYVAHADALYHFRPDKKLIPYLAAGIGAVRVEGDHYDDDTYAILNYGGGLKYYLTDNIALRGDVRHIYGPEDSYHNVSGMVGVTINFGGKKKMLAKTEESAPPVVMEKPPETPPVAEEKAPEPAVVDVEELKPAPVKEKLTINLNIQFDLDKAVVKPVYHEKLRKVADFMKAYPRTHAVVEGHTCNLASAAYNLKLSQRRADSVRAYLIRHFGIEPFRIKAYGYGMTRPVADNATEEGRMRNRRVLIVVSNGAEESAPASETGGLEGKSDGTGNVRSPVSGNAIREIRFEQSESGVKVNILASGPVDRFHSFRLDDPNRIVIDLPGSWQEPEQQAYTTQNGTVRKIRMGHHADKLRIVMDLSSDNISPFNVTPVQGGLVVSL